VVTRWPSTCARQGSWRVAIGFADPKAAKGLRMGRRVGVGAAGGKNPGGGGALPIAREIAALDWEGFGDGYARRRVRRGRRRARGGFTEVAFVSRRLMAKCGFKPALLGCRRAGLSRRPNTLFHCEFRPSNIIIRTKASSRPGPLCNALQDSAWRAFSDNTHRRILFKNHRTRGLLCGVHFLVDAGQGEGPKKRKKLLLPHATKARQPR